MKRILMVALASVLLVVLVGCANRPNDKLDHTQGEMPTDNKIALSTYIAGGILASADTIDEQTAIRLRRDIYYPLQNTETTEELKIEGVLPEVNVYFERLKFFLDEGVKGFEVQEKASSREGYEIELNYNVDGEPYTIYYNKDVDNRLSGLLIYNQMEFELVGDIESEVEEYEVKFKAIDNTNQGNWIEIELETEDERDEYEFEMEMKMVINGAYKEVKMDYSIEYDEESIELEIYDNNRLSKYEFEKERENDRVVYQFEYEVDNVKGEVKVLETVDETGKPVYRYKINEEGKRKDLDYERDDDDD